MDTPITRSSKITLSQKQFSKITGTIASVRKQRQHSSDDGEHESHYSRRSQQQADTSFIIEASFIRAPLNPRFENNTHLKHKSKKRDSLDGVPIEVQEAFILEDLLFVLMGISGTYITSDDYYNENDLQGIQFSIAPSLDSSLRDLTSRIIPLATSYTAVTAFIHQRSHLEHGLVNHALCASIRSMLKDYHTLLSQLEYAYTTSPHFSLQKLFFYVHPTLHTLSLLHTLILALTRSSSPAPSSESSESSDEESNARNEALGLAPNLKNIVKNMTLSPPSSPKTPPKGGEVLASLHKLLQAHAGDPRAQLVYGALLKDASKPYARVLRRWCERGYLEDPYDEFMVRESRFIDRGILERDYVDEYWERRYTLRDGSTAGKTQAPPAVELRDGACIPPLLESWKHKVLLAGKYLNVIRECGIEIQRANDVPSEDEELAMHDERFFKFIQHAYTYANSTLLNLLLVDLQLIPRLRTLKHYFFLSQSFFLTHFLDIAAQELRKPVKTASKQKLQTLLSVALNTDGVASTSGEVGRDDVRLGLQSTGLYEWLLKVASVKGAVVGEEEGGILDGTEETRKDKKDKDKDKNKTQPPLTAIDVFALDYTVSFPLSLVLSRKTILRYQLLFRFLLHLKHLEQTLSAMWTEHTAHVWRVPFLADGSSPDPSPPELDRWRRGVFALRARMLSVVQGILGFATVDVLEPHWRKLEARLTEVRTVDEVLRDHTDFLDTCLKECMLTSSRLLKQYQRLLTTCTTFTWYTSNFSKSLNQALSQIQSDPAGKIDMKMRWDFLNKFRTNFDHWLRSYIEVVTFHASSENAALMPLVGRLKAASGGP